MNHWAALRIIWVLVSFFISFTFLRFARSLTAYISENLPFDFDRLGIDQLNDRDRQVRVCPDILRELFCFYEFGIIDRDRKFIFFCPLFRNALELASFLIFGYLNTITNENRFTLFELLFLFRRQVSLLELTGVICSHFTIFSNFYIINTARLTIISRTL